MKIGIDARFWNETGVGRYIRNLVFELQKIDKKNQYVLVVLDKDKEAISSTISSSQITLLPTTIRWHSLKEQRDFPGFLAEQDFDLMHFPYFSVPIRYAKPYVVTIHDLILHHFTTGEATTLPSYVYYVKLQAYKFIIKQAAKRSKKIIAVSNATKDEIVSHLGVRAEKIAVTYEGIDKTIHAAKTSVTNYSRYFLHVGNVYPHKNTEYLLEAFKKAEIEDAQLLFVGKKDYFMQKLQNLVKKEGLEEMVKFLGFVDDSSLASLYQNALATVVPSLMEGFGLPVLEAMANEGVVIASDIPSLHEIGGKAVLYASPTDTKDLVEKLREVAKGDTEELKSLRKSGKERAQEFTWEKMAKETLQIYESSVGI